MGTDSTTEPVGETRTGAGYKHGGGSPSDVIERLKAELLEKQAKIHDLEKQKGALQRANTTLTRRIENLEAKLKEAESEESQEDRLQAIVNEPNEATRAAMIAKLSDAELRAYFTLRAGAPA